MALFITPTKDPSAVLDYGIDWSAWLGTDTIVASTWTVQAGITKGNTSFSATRTLVWLSGGTDGTDYTLTNRIVTAGGRTEERSLIIAVRNR